jgi:hypothetical protein
MEFLGANYLDTTTMINVDSGTLTIKNIFNPDKTKQWVSSGYNNDALTEILTIQFNQTTTLDRIALKEHNLKEFKIYYDNNTASVFSLVTGDTATLNYTGCSETSQFFNINSVACTSVSLYMTKTQSVNSEKAIGYLYLGQSLMSLPRIPAASNYKVAKTAVKITHTLSDGGKRLQKISEKWSASVKLAYLPQSDVENLETIFNLKSPMFFAPLGTCTGWSGILFEAVWEGDFGFWQYSDNAPTAGFEGSIKLSEAPW